MSHARSSAKAAFGVALLCVLCASPAAQAATTNVYRCLDARLNVVYTDVPCKDGEAFAIDGGEADPAALARLERLRDALDQSAVQRLSAERLAAQRVIPMPLPSEAGPDDYSDYGAYYTYPVAGYAPLRPRPLRPRPHHHSAMRGGAPPPPYIVPRP